MKINEVLDPFNDMIEDDVSNDIFSYSQTNFDQQSNEGSIEELNELNVLKSNCKWNKKISSNR